MKDLTGVQHFNAFDFINPENVGESEYRALYDLLRDSFDTDTDLYGEWIADDPCDFALAILDQVDSASTALRGKVLAFQATTTSSMSNSSEEDRVIT